MFQSSVLHGKDVRCGKSRVEGNTAPPHFRVDSGADGIAVNNINASGTKTGSVSSTRSPVPVSYWVTPAVANVTMVVAAADPGHLCVSMNFMNSLGYADRNINFSNLIKTVRILGLMALISYMAVILVTWIYANASGYVYFSAGEPHLLIKYTEWLLGTTGLFVAVDYLRKEVVV